MNSRKFHSLESLDDEIPCHAVKSFLQINFQTHPGWTLLNMKAPYKIVREQDIIRNRSVWDKSRLVVANDLFNDAFKPSH